MSNRLTKKEIQEMYPNQWVLLTDVIDSEKTHDLESAIVVDNNLDGSKALQTQFKTWPKYKAWNTTICDDNVICIGFIGAL